MSLTATEVLNFFDKARHSGHTTIKPNCDACGRPGCGVFACAYRESELSRGRRDPGNLCPVCAAINDNIVGRIIAEAKLTPKYPRESRYRRRRQIPRRAVQ